MESQNTFSIVKYIDLSNGETYAYREVGSGPNTVLVLHGNGAGSFSVFQLANFLSSTYRVIAPDLRGFGLSSYKTPITTHKELADDVKLFLDALKIPKCSVSGSSTGGPVAAYLAINHPENVEKLILFGSIGPQGFPSYKDDPVTKQPTSELAKTKEDILNSGYAAIWNLPEDQKKGLFKYIWNSLFESSKLDDKTLDELVNESILQKHPIEMMLANMEFNISGESNGVTEGNDLAKKIKAKTLVIHGTKDPIVNINEGKKWKKYLGELAQEELIEGGGHNPYDSQPERVGKLVKDFFN